ncbi:hypothetical protein [Oerskovia jenensis]|uniref:hypothetical protein n=1 Tax=Oerskovia jenensis TaxID=162169 RepID=UPI0036DD472F
MRTHLDEWVVDTDGLPDETRVRRVREVLALLAPDVAEVELDVVTPVAASPPGFAHAASVLRRRGGGPVEDPGYWTFHRAPLDAETWAAVLVVVPSSFCADFYGPGGGAPIVSLADEATSLVVRARGSRLAEVEALVGADRLVAWTQWHERRRTARQDARRRRSRRGTSASRS